MSEQYFHLTIGPVQAFVAQARRTRDFWAGSFVLSFLSSVAMSAVRQQGGEIQFPVPDNNYLSWLEGTNKPNAPKPLQGSRGFGRSGFPARARSISDRQSLAGLGRTHLGV